MERFGGICIPTIKSKRCPYENLVTTYRRRRALGLLDYIPGLNIMKTQTLQTQALPVSVSICAGSRTFTLSSPVTTNSTAISDQDYPSLLRFYVTEYVEQNGLAFSSRNSRDLQAELQLVRKKVI